MGAANLKRAWLVLCLSVLAGCASVIPPAAVKEPTAVLIVRRGWHIDVGLDAREMGGTLAFVGAQFPAARYVFFGFGDERYVRSKQHRLPALLAALWPGRGVMLVTAIDNTPAEAFGTDEVVTAPISAAQRTMLERYIRASFLTRDGTSPLQAGPYEGSAYYAATPGYSGLHTCNTWAAEALRATGLPVHSGGVLLAGQLWKQVRPLDRAGAY